MELEAYKKCLKCGGVVCGISKVGSDGWIYCVKCNDVIDII